MININILEIAQLMYIADLAVVGWFDYKYRYAYALYLVPCWIAIVLAAYQLIGAVTFFYAIILSVATLVLLIIGIKKQSRIGEGDIRLIIGLMWCFAETPLMVVATLGVTYLIVRLWIKIVSRPSGRGPRWGNSAPLATCLAIALGIVLPIALVFGVYRF